MNLKQFISTLSKGVTSYFLLESLFETQAFSKAISPMTDHWAIRLNEYCQDL
jgi:hypothetical protein